MNQFSRMETGVSTAAFGAGKSEGRPLSELAQFKAECRGTMCLLHVSGDVDTSNCWVLDAAIASVSRAHRGGVLVSFVDCKFVDSSCLGVLIRQFKLLPARLLIIAPLASRLRRLLDITSLTAALPVYNSLRQAELVIASDSRGSLGYLPMWKSSQPNRARLDEMMFMLRGSPRFRGWPS